MSENKKRDDEFINKTEKYERDYEKGKYPKKYSDIVEEKIDEGRYQTHSELEEKLKNEGVNKK